MPPTESPQDFESRVQKQLAELRASMTGRARGGFGISLNNPDPVWREAAARLVEEDANQMISEAKISPEEAEHARKLIERLRTIATAENTSPDR